MTLAAGRKLGSYEVGSSLGTGGMGAVYKAKDLKLGRPVAIKVLHKELAADPERLKRFEQEARAASALDHPNIVTIHDICEVDGLRFIVMQFVDGKTLRELIAGGRLTLSRILAIAIQIADGLAKAHSAGIAHRDLKPENIMVTEDGLVIILDFGLAKLTEPADWSEASTRDMGQPHTKEGHIVGTAPYMSPEQAQGLNVDARSDIFSFGSVLYEMVTGRRAFSEDTLPGLLAAIIRDDPKKVSEIRPDVPHVLERVITRALKKEPGRRFQHMSDMKVELQEIKEELDSGSAIAAADMPLAQRPSSWRRLSPFVVTALSAIVLGGLIVWGILRPGARLAPRAVTRTVISLAPGEELLTAANMTSGGYRSCVAISPDGRYVAYLARGGEGRHLYLRAMDELVGKPLDGAGGASMPFFSPDSQWVGFLAGGRLMKVSVSGGAPVTIAEVGGDMRGASWGPDGGIVFPPMRHTGLSRIPDAGGEPEVLTILKREHGEKTHRFPEVLPGGKAVLFTLAMEDIVSFDDSSIAVLSLETGEYRAVVEGGAHARYSSTGHVVYARRGALLAVPFDLDTLQVTGAPVTVLEGVTTSPIMGSAEFALSRDGSLVYVTGDAVEPRRRVLRVDRQGRTEPLIDTLRPFSGSCLSPDGRLLTTFIMGANDSVWLYDLNRGTSTRLTFTLNSLSPIWTPDGRRVTFASDREGGDSNIFWQAADGSDRAERLTVGEHFQTPHSWSPDGKILAFVERGDIWLLSMEGNGKPEPFLRTDFIEGGPMFSPDGRWIAYDSNESGRMEVYIRPLPGTPGKWQVSNGGGTRPLWNPNGKELFYRNGDRYMVVDVATEGELTLGKPRLLFEMRGSGGAYSVTPDGEHFVMVGPEEWQPGPTQLVYVQNWGEELKRLVP